MRTLLMSLVIAPLMLAGCTDDVAGVSEPVSLKLSGIKPDDVKNGTASEDKNVNTESGNPYGAFLKAARDGLGRDPSAIRVKSAYLRVHADSKNVTTFEQVFEDLELFAADSQTTIPIGTVGHPMGSSIKMTITASEADLAPLQAAMKGGDFKMGVRGTVQATTPADFDLRITIDAVFEALD